MKLSPEDIAYLREAAARDGYNPDDALKVFNYESSGRADVWGGKGGRYFGLFQAGPSERAQFHINTAAPTAKNQIDAFGQFLHARGYKPTMGLLDMYSTVNAGSPGHYNASDGNGTVSGHVAKMLGAKLPQGVTTQNSTQNPSAAMSYAQDAGSGLDTAGLQEILSRMPKQEEDLSPYLEPPTQSAAPVAGLLSSMGQSPELATNPQGDDMLRQMRDYHNQIHSLAVKGLL